MPAISASKLKPSANLHGGGRRDPFTRAECMLCEHANADSGTGRRLPTSSSNPVALFKKRNLLPKPSETADLCRKFRRALPRTIGPPRKRPKADGGARTAREGGRGCKCAYPHATAKRRLRRLRASAAARADAHSRFATRRGMRSTRNVLEQPGLVDGVGPANIRARPTHRTGRCLRHTLMDLQLEGRGAVVVEDVVVDARGGLGLKELDVADDEL
mmetsp:Transcript_37076/g.107031  ORF Transcript_37076/g.107031 Transcript_37076/m.107031 type:complete len:216 (+) Transcript_37076:36-683(+)